MADGGTKEPHDIRTSPLISVFDLAALLLTLSALFGWINRRFLHMPHAIGLVVLGLASASLLIAARVMLPDLGVAGPITYALLQIDFPDVVMNGMLAFLIFAGALSLDLRALRHRAWPIAMAALVGTVISTAVVGLAFYGAALWIGRPMSFAWALVFGALISPTDPVAVLTTLKAVRIPPLLEIEMQGEALFNDGVGIVMFTVLLGFASGAGGHDVSAAGVVRDLLQEAGGGLLLGTVTGYLAYRAMRAIDDFPVEVLITLSLVSGTYALAGKLGASGPLAVVAAGLLIGGKASTDAMSDQTQGYVTALWILIDEVLNSVLFLLIGLELVLVRFDRGVVLMAAAAVPIVLMARFVSVSLPILAFRRGDGFSARSIPFLTWAGVRGGISVALALALPDGDARPAILAATYAVVLFTVVVQGATLKRVARMTLPPDEDEPRPDLK